jgi:hypothetical protein
MQGVEMNTPSSERPASIRSNDFELVLVQTQHNTEYIQDFVSTVLIREPELKITIISPVRSCIGNLRTESPIFGPLERKFKYLIRLGKTGFHIGAGHGVLDLSFDVVGIFFAFPAWGVFEFLIIKGATDRIPGIVNLVRIILFKVIINYGGTGFEGFFIVNNEILDFPLDLDQIHSFIGNVQVICSNGHTDRCSFEKAFLAQNSHGHGVTAGTDEVLDIIIPRIKHSLRHRWVIIPQYCPDTRKRFSSTGIQTLYFGVGVGAHHDPGIEHAIQFNIPAVHCPAGCFVICIFANDAAFSNPFKVFLFFTQPVFVI